MVVMQPGINTNETCRIIALSALMISGLLFEIWITVYTALNYNFSNTPQINSILQIAVWIYILATLIALIWYGLIRTRDEDD